MDDVVDRLTERASWKAADLTKPGTLSGQAMTIGYVQPVESLLAEAAAEITRLRSLAAGREEWMPIETYDTKSSPDCVLVCYEDGSVTPAEYLEHCDGGPDDHQTWSPVWPTATRTCHELERDWPTHWRPLPKPPSHQEREG